MEMSDETRKALSKIAEEFGKLARELAGEDPLEAQYQQVNNQDKRISGMVRSMKDGLAMAQAHLADLRAKGKDLVSRHLGAKSKLTVGVAKRLTIKMNAAPGRIPSKAALEKRGIQKVGRFVTKGPGEDRRQAKKARPGAVGRKRRIKAKRAIQRV